MHNPFKKPYHTLKPKNPIALYTTIKVLLILLIIGNAITLVMNTFSLIGGIITPLKIIYIIVSIASIWLMMDALRDNNIGQTELKNTLHYKIYIRKINFYNCVFKNKPLKDIPSYPNDIGPNNFDRILISEEMSEYIKNIGRFNKATGFNHKSFMKLKLLEHNYPKKI